MRNWRYRRIIVSVAVSCILWVIICHVSEISNEKLFPEEKELQQLFDSGVSNRSIEVDLKLYIDRVKRMDTKGTSFVKLRLAFPLITIAYHIVSINLR